MLNEVLDNYSFTNTKQLTLQWKEDNDNILPKAFAKILFLNLTEIFLCLDLLIYGLCDGWASS